MENCCWLLTYLVREYDMLLIAATLLVLPISAPAPPLTAGACKWVYGRFNVWNGSSVRRIWIIGTRRLIALRDEDDDVPQQVRDYIYAGPYSLKTDGLFGDFRVCALESNRNGHMQHIRLTAVRRLTFRGMPFNPKRQSPATKPGIANGRGSNPHPSPGSL